MLRIPILRLLLRRLLMKKPKTSHPTTDNGLLAKNHTYTDLIDNEAFIFFPEKDNWRKRLIFTLEKWVEKDSSVELQQFYEEYKIPRLTVNDWRNKYKEVGEAFDRAKLTIASRRRMGALTKKYDKDMVLRDIHRYDDEWLEINKYHADLKKQETHALQPTTFVVDTRKPGVVNAEKMEEDRNADKSS